MNRSHPDSPDVFAVGGLAAIVADRLDDDDIRRRLGAGCRLLGCWRNGPAALLALAAGESTTVSGQAPAGEPVLVADARLDARAELGAALGLTDAVLAECDDTDLIGRAYRRWGIACPAHLLGDFAFVLWDPAAQRLLAACDPMRMRELHYTRSGTTLVVASGAALALRLADRPTRVDPLAIGGWLAGQPDLGRPVLADVELLPPGHVLIDEDGHCRVERCWRIDAARALHYPHVDDYAAHLAALLERCVVDRLADGIDTATQMSGGLDSTAVTAFAMDRLGADLQVVSHLYPNGGDCDESALIDAAARHLRIGNHLLLPVQPAAGTPYAAMFPPLLDSPGTVLASCHVDELTRLRKAGAGVLLTGSGGDEMTWGHSLSYTERLLRGDIGVIREVVDGTRRRGLPVLATLLNLFVRPLVPGGLKRLRQRWRRDGQWPEWIPDAAGAALRDARSSAPDDVPAFGNRALDARYAAWMNSSTYHAVRSYQAAGERTGISVRHPFFDRRLVEFSFAIPDTLWLRDDLPKWLLRNVMAGRLPDSIVWNRHKVVFEGHFARLISARWGEIARLLSHPALESLGLIDNARLIDAMRRGIECDPPTVSVGLLHALMAQVWVNRHAQQLGLDAQSYSE